MFLHAGWHILALSLSKIQKGICFQWSDASNVLCFKHPVHKTLIFKRISLCELYPIFIKVLCSNRHPYVNCTCILYIYPVVLFSIQKWCPSSVLVFKSNHLSTLPCSLKTCRGNSFKPMAKPAAYCPGLRGEALPASRRFTGQPAKNFNLQPFSI